MRAYDFWRPAHENIHAPGMLPLERTVPDEADLAALKADIAAARKQADVVVASFHWGDFLRPYHLTDHEKRTARFCIEQGADIVIGHHHHMLRGMEWIDGKPVLYGLGHFVFDLRFKLPDDVMTEMLRAATLLPPESYSVAPRAGWPLMPMHPDARMTMMAWVAMEGTRATGIGFVPCRLRPDGRVQPVSPDSDEGREVVAYMSKCQTTQGLNGRIEGGGPVIGGCASLRVVPRTADG
jgi:poly-gamma-glutamate synthesis protein (capsule biosynthesis protein)